MKKVMRRTLSLTMASAMIVGTAAGFPGNGSVAEAAEENVQQEFYVSADGSDQNDGSKGHPFATVERARQAVDEINDDMTGDIIVNIAPGDYLITETVQMSRSDSGTNGFEVIYRCSGEPGTARMIGGQKVSGWTPATQDDVDQFDMSEEMLGKVYKLQLDENTPEFNTMYVNGERAIMARTQNKEDSTRFPASKDEYVYASGGSASSISFPAGAFTQEEIEAVQNALDRGEEGAQVYGWDSDYRNWFTSTIPVAGISGTTLQFPESPSDNPQQYRPKYAFGSGARFFLQGNLAFLDVPGEYHYNKTEHVLYYYPKEGEENLDEQEVIVPAVQEVFHLEGDAKVDVSDVPDPDAQVHNITFEGLEIGYTEFAESYSSGWNAFDGGGFGVYPEEALQEGITQPSYCEQTERVEYRKGAVTLSQTNNITLDGVRIINTGLNGINAWGDNDHLTVTNTEIGHIGLHGINIDGGYPGPETGCYSYGHLITNNVIHDMGEMAGHGTGMQILQVHDSEFSHLEIYNAARRAIFLQGGWANRTDKDSGFVRYRDAHTYENHFEYLYMHDLQQDGGDDGAFFLCTLYGSWGDTSGTKPNYLNQIYMDNVGAPPSNKDFKPNGFNFDMGCAGVQVKNTKVVNPQHYNYRHDNGEVSFENVNVAYYEEPAASNYRNFDESRMEYDKIGVDDSFPYQDAVTSIVGKEDGADEDYKDLYFREEFDNGLDEWWSLAGTPQTSPVYYSDNDDWTGNSFLADAFYNSSSEGCRIGKPFGVDLNKIVEIDFFDHVCDGMENGYCGKAFQWMLDSFARVDDGNVQHAIGVDHNTDGTHYSYRVGNLTRATDVKREYGWHTFKWDYTSGTDVKMYIDDQLIATVPGADFSYIEMGDYGMGGFNAYDNVVIYGGEEAPDPLPLPEEPEAGEEEPEIKTLPGRLEAEEADSLPANSQIENISGGGKAVGYLTNGGEFVFNVTATEDFELPLSVSYASNNANAGFDLLVDGEKKMSVTLSQAEGWTSFNELTTDETVALSAGTHEIRVLITNNNFNLDWIAFGAGEPEEPQPVESVKPAVGEKLLLGIGNVVTVPVQVLPTDADNKALTWTTDDAEGSVITVAEDGTITAVAEGTASVTVTSQDNAEASATFAVEVQDMESSLISTTENGCVPSVSSSWDTTRYGADKLIDGSLSAEWASGGDADPQPTATLTWDTPQTVKTIYLYDRPNTGDWTKEVDVYVNGGETAAAVVKDMSNDGKAAGVLTFEEPLTDVTSLRFVIDREKNGVGALGLSEIKVYEDVPGEIPVSAVSFDISELMLFEGSSYTLNPPAAVPSTATNVQVETEIADGADVIRLTPNSTDGVLRNYTVTALKTGEAVIRATASNGVTAEIAVTVADKEMLADQIMEAEFLYGKYPGNSDAHKALRKVIDKAIDVYRSSEDMDAVTDIMEELQKAMEDFEAAASDQNPAEIAEGLTLENPQMGETMLKKPEVPFGFDVEIKETNPENVIYTNWVIGVPDKETEVEVTLLVTRISDGSTAEKVCTVTVPGCSAEDILDTVEIPAPEKNQEKLDLPEMPAGFELTVVSSTDDLIAEDGTITWPVAETEVTIVVRVTKTADGTYAEKEFSFTLPGVGKPYGEPISADEIDGLKGTYIKVQNGEVLNFNPGDWIRYDNVDFGAEDQYSSLYIETAVHPGWAGKTIEVVLDDINNGPVIGSIVVESKGDWGIYGEQEAVLNQKLSGYHTLYLRGVAGGSVPSEGVGGVRNIRLDAPSAAEPADKSELEALYNECKDMEQGNYTGSTWAAFDAARTAAAEVLAKEDATQEEVDQALEALRSAKDSLAVKGNKELLQKTYDYALTLSTDGVVDSAKEIFENAKAAAKAVLDNPDATQDEVNAAWNDLLEGIWGLGIVKGDKTNLGILIDRAEAMAAEADRYVEENWQQLTDALAAAKDVYADGDALKDDVETAADALLNAILAQRYKANKDNLQSLVDSLADIDLSKYTDESVQVFKTALAQANAILADETLSADDQAKVDAAVEELAAARDGLVAKADDTGNGSGDNGSGDGGSSDDENTGSNGGNDNGTSGNGSSDGNSADNGSSVNKAAKTGDNANIVLIVVVLIVAAAAVVGVIVVRKRKNH